MSAESREAVFAALRKQGIKAIKVVASDGSKANGEIRGVRKRMVVLAVFVAFVLAVVATLFTMHSTSSVAGADALVSASRRQVIGDAAVIEKGIRTGWADVFVTEGDRFLASFAIPGYSPTIRSTTEEMIEEALRTRAPAYDSNSLEKQQIVAIVEGMKDELRRFLKSGGTIKEYGQRLVERQELEIRYYNRAKNELDAAVQQKLSAAQLTQVWEECNDKLRRLGIKLLPYPEEEE